MVSRLEEAAKPLMLPMFFSHERRALSPDDQRILATWATKFSMVLTYHNRDPASRTTYLMAERQALKARLRPPSGTWVWLAHYTGLTACNADASQIREQTDAERRFPLNSNRTTVTIGQMALQLLRVRTLERVEVRTPPPWDRALVQIWPTRETVDWPPRVDLSDSVFAAFKDRFVSGDSGIDRAVS
jgi:hypothetical protein